MPGKLAASDMDQLEQWIGEGSKKFTLLYAITRDGCNANTFHQLCDNKGPTVTVLYNPQGSVYGGYTNINWTKNNQFPNATEWDDIDVRNFLFQLKFNQERTLNMFPYNWDGYPVHSDQNYGPTFGFDYKSQKLSKRNAFSTRHRKRSEDTCMEVYPIEPQNRSQLYWGELDGPTFGGRPDLHTFTGKIGKSGRQFRLNGSLNIGHSYTNTAGISMNNINNGNMIVTELEVYQVTDQRGKAKTERQNATPTTWRKTPTWNGKFLGELMDEITAFKPVPDLDIGEARLLMLGPVGAGKSSFYNTINSIFRGRITQKAGSGSAEQSLTTAYTPYFVKVRSGGTLNFRICDIRGLEDSQGIDVIECNYLLDGHVPEYYQFNPATPISPNTRGFISKPTLEEKIHCVVFVLDSTTVEVLPDEIIQKMKSFQTLMNQKGIPQAILLTKIDKLCQDVERNTAEVFSSSVVEENVEKVSQLLGLPRGNVLPVKNYENEMQLDEGISILSLLSLRQILNFAEDYMEALLDKMAAFNKRRDTKEKTKEKK